MYKLAVPEDFVTRIDAGNQKTLIATASKGIFTFIDGTVLKITDAITKNPQVV
jgi:hypothetical protein